ncbi:hypothetical protein PZ897_17615 [Hoeflea sp. YIM 152468]|uniref:hypothetical protein n=1 Tax=Hoeflea sp. YIM 152468 TaxID=3031759 RepID=UPI0023DCB574|nr:hypothetical protein [Hoeflea sp. YIM 152468]MDF1610002.1 hypothetical protein [Hoeflea sp. YIM 152468]
MFSPDESVYLAGIDVGLEVFPTDEGESVAALIAPDGEAFLLIHKTRDKRFVFTDRQAKVVGRYADLRHHFEQPTRERAQL